MHPLFFQPDIQKGTHFLAPDESKHCAKVLRMKTGDLIQITDGMGFFYTAHIQSANPVKCTFEVITRSPGPGKKFHIHLVVAPTKNPQRMEWMVEKCVEIGVVEFSFILCEHSEPGRLNFQRLQKITVSAMKQSNQAILPILHEPVPFSEFLRTTKDQTSVSRFIAVVDPSNPIHLHQAEKKNTFSTLLIGPEGDFSEKEKKSAMAHGFLPVSLGDTRLRTETAGLMGAHLLTLLPNQ